MSQRLELTTWCSGVGPPGGAANEHHANGEVVLEAVVLWVPVDSTGHPVRIQSQFRTPTERRPRTQGPGRVVLCEPGAQDQSQPWPFVERTWTWWAT